MSQEQALSGSLATQPSALPPAFACALRAGDTGAGVHLQLSGELDIAAIAQLQPILQDAQSRGPLVVLDLSHLTFIDCAGVRAIVNASAAARKRGHRLILIAGPPHVDRVFRLTGYSENVQIGVVGESAVSLHEAGARHPGRDDGQEAAA